MGHTFLTQGVKTSARNQHSLVTKGPCKIMMLRNYYSVCWEVNPLTFAPCHVYLMKKDTTEYLGGSDQYHPWRRNDVVRFKHFFDTFVKEFGQWVQEARRNNFVPKLNGPKVNCKETSFTSLIKYCVMPCNQSSSAHCPAQYLFPPWSSSARQLQASNCCSCTLPG